MANPQIENGHLDLANEIVEALAKIRLSGEETQCLWVILRKTYCWHKKEDQISLSQFALATGLTRPSVARAIKKLLTKKITEIIKKDNTYINIYRFNKDFDQWQPLTKKITLCKSVDNIDNRVLTKKYNTKESITKEKIKRLSQVPCESQPKPVFNENQEPKAYVMNTPLQKVVCGFKIVSGYDKEDRAWDKAHFKRASKSAKILLDFFGGDYVKAVDCIEDLANELKKKDLSWTLETIVKHCANYKLQKERGEYNGKAI